MWQEQIRGDVPLVLAGEAMTEVTAERCAGRYERMRAQEHGRVDNRDFWKLLLKKSEQPRGAACNLRKAHARVMPVTQKNVAQLRSDLVTPFFE